MAHSDGKCVMHECNLKHVVCKVLNYLVILSPHTDRVSDATSLR